MVASVSRPDFTMRVRIWEVKLWTQSKHWSTAKIVINKDPKLPGWKGTEQLACAGDDISGAHMMQVYLPKAVVVGIKKLLHLLVIENMDLRTRL